ncbi:hypothetical protein C8Q75DRAFT_838852 [Abortiporus biennis]|nr:hypothetical protein C8Q75DRAFT_838852 [Abortiporus biennis]
MCGTPNVPSFYALRKLQSQLTKELNILTTLHVSPLGNEFFVNGPVELFHLDWANPLVRPHIHPFVEVSETTSEFYQADRLKNEDIDLLQPMWADFKHTPRQHYYIKELASLSTREFVIPIKWICILEADEKGKHKETYHADVLFVNYNNETSLFSIDDEAGVKRISVDNLAQNFHELEDSLKVRDFQICFHKMPHSVQKMAKGKATFTLNIMTWADDVSGNRTKQFNAHTNVYLANLSLPHQKLQQEYFIRFCSTSQHASALELLEAVADDLEEEILFRIMSRIKPGDNPQQSDFASHIGGGGNCNCHRCKIGGNYEHAESNEGYAALFLVWKILSPVSSVGEKRTADETLIEIKAQLLAAMHGNAKMVKEMQTGTRIKDSIAQHWIDQLIVRGRELHKIRLTNPDTRDARLNKKQLPEERKLLREGIEKTIEDDQLLWLYQQPPHRYVALPHDSVLRNQIRPGDHYNILFSLDGLDVHRDMPIEILYTYLLGQAKYVWYKTHTSWTDAQQELMAVRLHSSSVDGLSIGPVRGRYLVKYKNALVGKHFKTLQQVGVFHIYGELAKNSKILDLWKASGELGALLWYHSIEDMKTYIEDLKVLIANVLDIWSSIDPQRIIDKIKLHLYLHTPEDIQNFGPAIIFSTEIFECWNAIFRTCSVLSNHQAASHDIAMTLADLERFKHMVSGGWWKSGDQYVCAGTAVQDFLKKNPELQRRLGWADSALSSLHPGEAKLPPKSNRIQSLFSEIICDLKATFDHQHSDPISVSFIQKNILSQWVGCNYIVSESRDLCRVGSWVFYKTAEEQLAGRISKIIVLGDTSRNSIQKSAIVLVEHFDIADQNDTRINMPVLTRPGDQTAHSIQVIPSSAVQFIFNAQHDCHNAKCDIQDTDPVTQERRKTMLLQGKVQHKAVERYLLNIHALHNAHLIRKVLPRSLTMPVPYFTNRNEKHHAFAASLRVTGPAKRAAAQAKAKETREARKNQAKGEESDGS